MRKLQRIIASLMLLLLAFCGYAQAPDEISFLNETHDFGTIQESAGLQNTVFEFLNNSSQPVVLTAVRPSCGCTAADYTKAPIAPGQKGFVKASYNPQGRPGAFNKSIAVNYTVGDKPGNKNLYIKGTVEQTAKTPKELHPYAMGPLNLNSLYVAFGNLKTTETRTSTVEFLNTTTQPITLEFNNLPSYVTTVLMPSGGVVQPNATVLVSFTLDAAKIKKPEPVLNFNLPVTINKKNNPEYLLKCTAGLQTAAAPVEQLNAPKLMVEKLSYNVGAIKVNTKKSVAVKISNQGKSNLIIQSALASDNQVLQTSNTMFPLTIAPNTSETITVTFAAGKQNLGKQVESVTLYTNDPQKSQQKVFINAQVTP